jgi:hypothetical protein
MQHKLNNKKNPIFVFENAIIFIYRDEDDDVFFSL